MMYSDGPMDIQCSGEQICRGTIECRHSLIHKSQKDCKDPRWCSVLGCLVSCYPVKPSDVLINVDELFEEIDI